jgi:hypothetical protein
MKSEFGGDVSKSTEGWLDERLIQPIMSDINLSSENQEK